MNETEHQGEAIENLKEKSHTLTVPHAVILGSFVIALAILIGLGSFSSVRKKQVDTDVALPAIEKVRKVSDIDHIRGDIKAPVQVIIYSDFECAFCKRFHVSMQRLYNEYGVTGKIVWIERHLPLERHPNAKLVAVASECAKKLGGNDGIRNNKIR